MTLTTSRLFLLLAFFPLSVFTAAQGNPGQDDPGTSRLCPVRLNGSQAAIRLLKDFDILRPCEEPPLFRLHDREVEVIVQPGERKVFSPWDSPSTSSNEDGPPGTSTATIPSTSLVVDTPRTISGTWATSTPKGGPRPGHAPTNTCPPGISTLLHRDDLRKGIALHHRDLVPPQAMRLL